MNEERRSQQTAEKLDVEDIKLTRKSKLWSKLDNFWFHYKWPVIIGAFFAIILIIGLVQIIGKDDKDNVVVFAGPAQITPNQCAQIEQELSKILPDDLSDDDKKSVAFKSYAIYSEEEFKLANEAETLANGQYDTVVTTSQNSANYKDYDDYLQTRECSIYFVSPDRYDNFKTYNQVCHMSEIFGENIPDGMMEDGYGFMLGQLPLYQIDAFQVMPANTIVCLLKQPVVGSSSDDETYESMEKFFKAIINFGR